MKTIQSTFFVIVFSVFFVIHICAADKAVGSITVSQVDTFAFIGMQAQPVIKVVIDVTGTTSTLELQKLVIKTANTDNADVDSVAVYTCLNDRFSLIDFPGEASLLGKRKEIINDSVVLDNIGYLLKTGKNYFYVTMDLNTYSKASHTLDAYIPVNGIKIGGILFPSVNESPVGNIAIHTVYFRENFERKNNDNLPVGWDQLQYITAIKKWICNYGGYKLSTYGNPIAPKSGALNAMLQKQSYDSDTVILISRPLDLSLSSKSVLTFYHAQVGWCKDAYCNVIDNDELGIVYKIGETGEWNEVVNYPLATPNTWLKRTVILPPQTSAKYVSIGFRGITKYGWGTCIDSVVVYEADVVNRELKEVLVSQPKGGMVPQNSDKNPVLRINFRIKGNNGDIHLNSLKITSKNTSDNDIKSGGVKLYYTNDSLFLSPVQVGSGETFSEGSATFSGLSQILETGDNYYWVTYDVKSDAYPGNILDASINAGDVVLDVGAYPSVLADPIGDRFIKQSIFCEDFEDLTPTWALTGLFQIEPPEGLGGLTSGMPDPSSAYSGSNVLGTALTPVGDYEPNISAANAYKATSPLIDATYFKNIRLDYVRWLNIDNTDTVSLEYKLENETNWKKIWGSDKKFVETKWQEQSFTALKALERKKFNLRFKLGHTDAINNYSGLNIDYLFVTADSIPMDGAVTSIIHPKNSCSLTSTEKVKVMVKNNGPNTMNNTPVKLSLNGGKTYITETINVSIASGDSLEYEFSTVSDFSKPSIYPIVVKVAHPRDNYPDNDSTSRIVASLPTYSLPFREDFEQDTTLWVARGRSSSWLEGIQDGINIWPPDDGGKYWKTNNNGFHNLYEYSYVESPCFSFSSTELPMVDIKFNVDATNQKDGGILEYSLDEGQTWTYVTEDSYPFSWAWYNDTITSLKHKGWTNQSLDWMQGRQFLPAAVAKKPKVRFRVVFKSDSTTVSRKEGFAFNDFEVYDAPHDIGVFSINSLSSPACQYANSPFLNVTLKNYGYQKMKTGDKIYVAAMVNDNVQAIDTMTLSADLIKDATVNYTLKKRVNFDAASEYVIKVFTLNEMNNSFYGTDNDTATIAITVRPNPVLGLRKSYHTARLDTLKLSPIYSADYSYKWTYKGEDSLIRVKTAKDTGKYVIEVTNTTTLCKTKDTISVLPLKLDVGIAQIIDPVTNCGYSTSFKPVVRIKNFGTDTLVKNKVVPIRIRLNGGTLQNDNLVLSKALAPDSSYTTQLNWAGDFSAAGNHQLMVRTNMSPYDSDETNDSTQNTFTIYSYPTLELGPDIYVKATSHTIKLTSGYASYAWSDGSDKDSLRITQTGKYKVSITNSNGCVTTDSIVVRLGIHDVMVKRLTSPVNSCTLPNSNTISCKLMNNGSDTIKLGENITLEYSVNGQPAVSQQLTLTAPLLPNDSITFDFSQKQDLSIKNTYNIKVKATVASDLRRDNDSITVPVKVFGNPSINLGNNDIVHALSYTLNPGLDNGKRYKEYRWQDNSTDSIFIITQTHMDTTHTYSVTVTDQNGCQDRDTIILPFFVDDLKLLSVMSPDSTCPRANPENLYVKVVNTGNQTLSGKEIIISYKFDSAGEISESFKFSGKPKDTVTFKFNTPLNLRLIGSHKLFTTLRMTGDLRLENDTITRFLRILNGGVIDFGAVNDTLFIDLPHVLDAGSGNGFTYLWSTGATSQTILATQSAKYSVTVTSSGCISSREVNVVDKVYDLAVNSIIMPSSVCVDGKKKAVKVEIMNTGNVPLTDQTVKVKYQVNSGTWKTKDVNFTGKYLEKQEYAFEDSIDVATPMTASVIAGIEFSQDEVVTNNEKSSVKTFMAVPVINFGAVNDTIKVNTYPYTLDAGAGLDYTYLWQDNSSARIYQVTQDGRYTVTVSNGGCSTSQSVAVVGITPVIIVKGDTKLKLYPNPASEVLYLDISLTDNKDVIVEFVSASGKIIHSRSLAGSRKYMQTIDVSRIPKGLYYVRVHHKGRVAVEKVMVQ